MLLITKNDLLNLIPILRKLNEFLMRDYPDVLFVKDLIELNQKFISQEESIKSVEDEKIPEDLLKMVKEISELKDLVELTISRDEAANGLIVLARLLGIKDLPSKK